MTVLKVAEANMQAARGVVLQAEGKDEQALAALANNGNHWAMLAHYQALARLGRRDEAERILRTLFDQVPTDVFSTGLPVAKYRFGNVISNP